MDVEEKCAFCCSEMGLAADLPDYELMCKHRFHKKCLRQNIRYEWGSGREKTVDTKSRKVCFILCPLCRFPVDPDDLRALQRNDKFINLKFFVDADPCGISIFSVEIRKRDSPVPPLHERTYHAHNLPEMGPSPFLQSGSGSGGEPATTPRIIWEDFPVTAESSADRFCVSLRRVHPDPLWLRRYEVHAKDLESLEPDCEEERETEEMIRRMVANRDGSVRIVSPERHRLEHDRRVEQSRGDRPIGGGGGGGGGGTGSDGSDSSGGGGERRRGSAFLRNLLSEERMDSVSPPLPSFEELRRDWAAAFAASASASAAAFAASGSAAAPEVVDVEEDQPATPRTFDPVPPPPPLIPPPPSPPPPPPPPTTTTTTAAAADSVAATNTTTAATRTTTAAAADDDADAGLGEPRRVLTAPLRKRTRKTKEQLDAERLERLTRKKRFMKKRMRGSVVRVKTQLNSLTNNFVLWRTTKTEFAAEGYMSDASIERSKKKQKSILRAINTLQTNLCILDTILS